MAKVLVFFAKTLTESRSKKLPDPPINAVSATINFEGIWVRCNSKELAKKVGGFRGAIHFESNRVVQIIVPPDRQSKWQDHLLFLFRQNGMSPEKK